MDGKYKKYGYLILAICLIAMLAGCSVFISTPRVTRIQIQGMDDELWEYVVTLEEPMDDSLGFRISDRYSLQFDFEWLWNTDVDADAYSTLDSDFDGRPDTTPMAPWLLCRYHF